MKQLNLQSRGILSLGVVLLLSIFFIIISAPNANAESLSPDSTEVAISASPTDVEVKVTAGEVYKDVKSALGQLAAGLKVGAEHVYSILVKQQFVKSIYYSSFWILCISCFIYLARILYLGDSLHERDYLKNRGKSYEELVKIKTTGWGEEYNYEIRAAIAVVAGLILLIPSVAYTDDMLTGFFNPEYGAIQEVINMVKR